MSLTGKSKSQILITTKKSKSSSTVESENPFVEPATADINSSVQNSESLEVQEPGQELPAKLSAEINNSVDFGDSGSLFGVMLPRLANVGDLINFEAEIISRYNELKTILPTEDNDKSPYSEEMMLEQILQWINLKSN